MAKYYVTHTCGCTREYQLFGKHADREYKISKLEQDICNECARKQAHQEAVEKMSTRGLSSLEGSEKQVAWAITLREATCRALDCIRPYATTPETQQMVSLWEEKIHSLNEAKWWIDNRDSLPKAFWGATDENTAKYAARNIVSEFIRLFK